MTTEPSIVIQSLEDKIAEIDSNRRLAGILTDEKRPPDAIDEYPQLKADRQINIGIYFIALDTIAKEYELYRNDVDKAVTIDIIANNLNKEEPLDLLRSLIRLKHNYPAIYRQSPADFDRIEQFIRDRMAKNEVVLPFTPASESYQVILSTGEKTHIFADRTTCVIGRHEDCSICIPNDTEHSNISRFHCFLDINPPQVRIRDFGSRNGTYVNDKIIGQRPEGVTAEEGTKMSFPEVELQNGDAIKLGSTIWRVEISTSPESSNDLDNKNPVSVPPPVANKSPGVVNKLFPKVFPAKAAKTIDGYELLELLTSSDYTEVYLARHIETGNIVALKTMLPQVAANDKAVRTFLREADNVRVLNHPNVVRMHDRGRVEGVFYFTMDYCNSGNVEDLLRDRGGKLSLEEAMTIVLPVLDGLIYAHNVRVGDAEFPDGKIEVVRGLVHRDLKPANILIDIQNDTKVIKIGNYGLAKAFDLAGMSGMSVTNSATENLSFMPRQQILNFRYVKPDVDVWATAASLYYMLTGQYPRNISGDPIAAILTNPIVPIREREPSIPVAIAKVIDTALQENPRIHFQSAKELKEQLQKFDITAH
jgi:eukaryotic-like serine/threonine-protein kinase